MVYLNAPDPFAQRKTEVSPAWIISRESRDPSVRARHGGNGGHGRVLLVAVGDGGGSARPWNGRRGRKTLGRILLRKARSGRRALPIRLGGRPAREPRRGGTGEIPARRRPGLRVPERRRGCSRRRRAGLGSRIELRLEQRDHEPRRGWLARAGA